MKSEETDAELNGEDDDEEEVADENDQQEDSAAADAADIGDHNEYGGDGDVDENEDDVGGGGGNADKNEDDGNNASMTGDDGGANAAAIVNDIDMTDIMVIDEYDSTKPETKKSSGTSATTATNVVVTKPLDDREKRQLEKRYQLADNPHIICHPSRTAKSGKFSCNIMSLSILLDYRPEDTKEHSFEVSLFAELFNEMLMRDFGFNIYKAMYAMPEKSAKEEAADEKASAAAASDDKEKRDAVAAKDDGKSDAAADDAVDKDRSNDSCDRRSTKELTATKSTDRKRRRDDETDDESSIRSGDPKRKTADGKSSSSTNPVPRNFYTFDPELLLSFVYFDTTHCGYIFEKDIEELFYTLGLNLSRSQTRRVVARAVTRDSLFYRKLTDKSREVKVEDEGETATIAENANALTDSSVVATETVVDIARGNKSFLPIFRLGSGSSNVAALQSAKMEEDCSSETTTENGTNAQTGMILLFMCPVHFFIHSLLTGIVLYKGSFVDIEKLMEQMRRSEKARDDTEELLVDLRKTNADLLASSIRAKDKIKDLQADVKSYSRKLSDTEASLSSCNVSFLLSQMFLFLISFYFVLLQKKATEYHSILASVHDRVSTIFVKNERKNDV